MAYIDPDMARQAAKALRAAFGGYGSPTPEELPSWSPLYALDDAAEDKPPVEHRARFEISGRGRVRAYNPKGELTYDSGDADTPAYYRPVATETVDPEDVVEVELVELCGYGDGEEDSCLTPPRWAVRYDRGGNVLACAYHLPAIIEDVGSTAVISVFRLDGGPETETVEAHPDKGDAGRPVVELDPVTGSLRVLDAAGLLLLHLDRDGELAIRGAVVEQAWSQPKEDGPEPEDDPPPPADPLAAITDIVERWAGRLDMSALARFAEHLASKRTDGRG